MRMQEVIGKMREIVPHAMSAASNAQEKLGAAFALFQDFTKCESSEARTLLAAKLTDMMDTAKFAVQRTFVHVSNLSDLNDGYTRKLGPKKPKDDPRQPDLPGLEDDDKDEDPDGGTTSCGQLANNPSWHTSGRHG